VYQKAAGSWSVVGNIKGATGATGTAGTNGTNGADGANGPGYVSGGRLTLTSGVPYLVSESTTAVGTVFFTPAVGNTILLYNGTSFVPTTFTEVSQALTDTTKSPAASAASKCYDLFAWNDAGTFRVTRGPAWTSTVVRGAGTALVTVGGILLNNASITNGPAAQRGTYVGTIVTTTSNNLMMMFGPAAATGGNNNNLCVWNMYNRTKVRAINLDATVSWTYTTGAWQMKNASQNNQIIWVQGLDGLPVTARQTQNAASSTAALCAIGFGVDSLTAIPADSATASVNTSVANAVASATATYTTRQGLGAHFMIPLEVSVASGVTTWYGIASLGAGSVVPIRSSFEIELEM
jgi:hypothetical protein